MSKNELLNVISAYLDELELSRGVVSGGMDEDELNELIEEAIEDFASREGYATESMVQRAIDDSIENEINERDLVDEDMARDIVVDYVDGELDSAIENYLSGSDFVTQDDLDGYVNENNFDEYFDDYAFRLEEKIGELEGRLAMFEAIEILESVKKC